ncbi:hypothetical protein SAY86_020302 [Trapa natans]|uniref:Rhamnogalacturonan lyase domain-containing protein n=1 Tax=Trapa natans TaxID=22666 RepID=A0AAN7LIT9_TRANT|nr:hypothetical protein SAY86_020302 [Trapa natans]
MAAEVQNWPYNFPASADFEPMDSRGFINGRLLVRDRFMSEQLIPAKGAYVGLAPPGEAGSWQMECKVRINTIDSPAWFSTEVIGHDNAIARHGIHGLYRLFSVQIPGNLLVAGDNSIFLSQTMATSPFQGVMYDYIRLEGPSPPPATEQ